MAAIQAKGEITVALEGTWSPWGYHDQSGELVGYDVEVARAIAEKLGVKAAFVEGEFNGLLAGLEGELARVAVIFTALPTASLLAAFTIQYDPSRDSQFEAAATVLLSTLLSAFTIPLWAAVLGVCYP